MNLEIEDIIRPAMRYGMFSKAQFLEAVKAKAKNQAEIARALKISEAAVTGLYNGTRKLAYDEAAILADLYDIDPNQLTEGKLIPVLRVCLRYAPREWSDQSVARLAQEILFGLELLRSGSSIEPSQDAIEVAARAIADRFRNRLGDTTP